MQIEKYLTGYTIFIKKWIVEIDNQLDVGLSSRDDKKERVQLIQILNDIKRIELKYS